MPRGQYLKHEEKQKILALRQEGRSIYSIAFTLGRSHTVVSNFLRDTVNYGTHKTGGPKEKLTQRDKCGILKASNSMKSCTDIIRDCELNVSQSTVYRVLKASDHIHGQNFKSAPRLLPTQKVARLTFAQLNLQTNWQQVIFSNDNKFNLDGPADLHKEPRFSKKKFGGGSLMTWGAFSSKGILDLAFLTSRLTSDSYTQLLDTHLLPFMRTHANIKWTFQQDNGRVHKSHATCTWLMSNNANVMEWPTCSRDLNPMTNVWYLITSRIYANNKRYANLVELKSAVINAANDINEHVTKCLILSMPKRMLELTQSEGDLTSY